MASARSLTPGPGTVLEKHADGVVPVVYGHRNRFPTIQSAAELSAIGQDDRERNLAVRMVGQHHNASGGRRLERRGRDNQPHQD